MRSLHKITLFVSVAVCIVGCERATAPPNTLTKAASARPNSHAASTIQGAALYKEAVAAYQRHDYPNALHRIDQLLA